MNAYIFIVALGLIVTCDISFQGINFFTETKTVTSLWRSDDADAGKVATAMPVQK